MWGKKRKFVCIGETMKTLLRIYASVIVIMFSINIIGCGERVEDDESPLLLRANPTPGSNIEENSTITVTFDRDPGSVQVNVGTATISGTTVTIEGPFPEGQLKLTITWEGGDRDLTYTIGTPEQIPVEPEIEPDPEPVAPDGMVLIPDGEFEMGSDDGDADNDEQPVHTVFLDAFFIDENEVTNAEFKDFILANPEWQKKQIDEKFKDDNYLFDWQGNNYPNDQGDYPVRFVSWYAAMAYAVWVDKRLPTEAEWEKAARGGLKDKKYPWGNDINAKRANYGKRLGHTTPVGDYPPNDYGVYDMAGNVWEWCLDGYLSDFYANSPRENPVAVDNNVEDIVNDFENIVTNRVLRGSGWNGNPEWLRAANRHGTGPNYAGIGALGFRCAKDIE